MVGSKKSGWQEKNTFYLISQNELHVDYPFLSENGRDVSHVNLYQQKQELQLVVPPPRRPGVPSLQINGNVSLHWSLCTEYKGK